MILRRAGRWNLVTMVRGWDLPNTPAEELLSTVTFLPFSLTIVFVSKKHTNLNLQQFLTKKRNTHRTGSFPFVSSTLILIAPITSVSILNCRKCVLSGYIVNGTWELVGKKKRPLCYCCASATCGRCVAPENRARFSHDAIGLFARLRLHLDKT